MADSYLGTRLSLLRTHQNADGGWSYFPGKSSWLEPTIYAALALHGSAEADRAWALVKTWQNADGGWRPSATVELSHAATALSVTAALARGDSADAVARGVQWLVGTAGNESRMLKRVVVGVGRALGMVEDQRDFSLKGWPWKPDTASWVEPTAHALVALRQAAAGQPKLDSNELRERVRLGESMILDVRSKDGGWNYGNRTARGEDLRSYPETTAIALIGLQRRRDLGTGIDLAQKMLAGTASPLARAWLTMAMRVNDAAADELTGEPSQDILITALEALAATEGNHRFMRADS